MIRTHLPEISQEDIDRAALQGILTEFQSQLEIVATPVDVVSNEQAESGSAALTRYYESSIGYLAAPLINRTALDAIQSASSRLDSEQILDGLILDLRHVPGSDYSILPQITGLFTTRAQPLLDWGEGVQNVVPQSTQIKTPLVALIDETTQGAGEALAAIIRTAKLGILVGRRTAGEARSFEIVPLKSGQALRLATGDIRLADGAALTKNGVQPDIVVARENTLPTETSAGAASNEPKNNPIPALNAPLGVPADDPILSRGHELLKSLQIVERRKRTS